MHSCHGVNLQLNIECWHWCSTFTSCLSLTRFMWRGVKWSVFHTQTPPHTHAQQMPTRQMILLLACISRIPVRSLVIFRLRWKPVTKGACLCQGQGRSDIKVCVWVLAFFMWKKSVVASIQFASSCVHLKCSPAARLSFIPSLRSQGTGQFWVPVCCGATVALHPSMHSKKRKNLKSHPCLYFAHVWVLFNVHFVSLTILFL